MKRETTFWQAARPRRAALVLALAAIFLPATVRGRQQPPAAKPPAAHPIDHERLSRELGTAAVPEDASADPLLEIVRQMRAAQDHILRHDAGPATQAAQRQIVSQIDKLLEQARKASRGSPSQTNPQSVSPRTTPPPGTRPNPSGTGNTKAGKGPAAQANAPNERSKPRPITQKQLQQMLESLPDWGRLSARQREQMLQLPAEEFLPKYQEMIEDYYRRLSQPPDEGAPP
jgi:hypothetical protein